jgi:hypothetical protein
MDGAFDRAMVVGLSSWIKSPGGPAADILHSEDGCCQDGVRGKEAVETRPGIPGIWQAIIFKTRRLVIVPSLAETFNIFRSSS